MRPDQQAACAVQTCCTEPCTCCPAGLTFRLATWALREQHLPTHDARQHAEGELGGVVCNVPQYRQRAQRGPKPHLRRSLPELLQWRPPRQLYCRSLWCGP
jgi:hypothetical protein